MEYAAMMRRLVRTYGERVADGDPEDLADMLGVRDALDAAIAEAVRSMHEDRGLSWASIARGAGTSRQAAQQRWGRPSGGEATMRGMCKLSNGGS